MNLFEALITFIGAIAFLVLLSFLLSWPVYMLWNYCLVGTIDGIHETTWLNAWGLTVLANMLFKSHSSKKD